MRDRSATQYLHAINSVAMLTASSARARPHSAMSMIYWSDKYKVMLCLPSYARSMFLDAQVSSARVLKAANKYIHPFSRLTRFCVHLLITSQHTLHVIYSVVWLNLPNQPQKRLREYVNYYIVWIFYVRIASVMQV